jgi:hypothetical protein
MRAMSYRESLRYRGRCKGVQRAWRTKWSISSIFFRLALNDKDDIDRLSEDLFVVCPRLVDTMHQSVRVRV